MTTGAQGKAPREDELRRVLHDHIVNEILLRDAPLAPDDDLFDAGFDSMSLARMLVFVEQRFGVMIPDEEVVVEKLATLDGMTAFVAGYIAR